MCGWGEQGHIESTQGQGIILTFSSHPMPNPSGRAVNSPFKVYPKFTWGFPGGTVVKNLPANAGDSRDAGSIPGSLEKEMANYSNTLAWKIPRTEEPGGLQPMGSQGVGHDLATKQQALLTTSISPTLDQASIISHLDLAMI